MPRPRKCRKVCFMPQHTRFGPMNNAQNDLETIIMTVDEYETIRLMDIEEMSQEECSQRMGVARTTIQRIYEIARRKLARALVYGHVLIIEGGDYSLCNQDEIKSGCGRCKRGRFASGHHHR